LFSFLPFSILIIAPILHAPTARVAASSASHSRQHLLLGLAPVHHHLELAPATSSSCTLGTFALVAAASASGLRWWLPSAPRSCGTSLCSRHPKVKKVNEREESCRATISGSCSPRLLQSPHFLWVAALNPFQFHRLLWLHEKPDLQPLKKPGQTGSKMWK